MKSKYRNKSDEQKIAKGRILDLFKQAHLRSKEANDLSDRYVKLARKIAMKYKVRIPSSLQKRFCKHCNKYLIPSVNCRIRTKEGHLVYYCLSCKKFMRFPYKK